MGSLKRVVVSGRRRRYSPGQVEEICEALEEELGLGPATRPGLPPEEPTRLRRFFDRALSFPESAVLVALIGLFLALSFAFPAQSARILSDFSSLYELLAAALR